MTTMMMLLSIILTILFCFNTHPLSMGLILLTQSIMVSIITGLHTNSFWYSYILFIIMVGSMLILFLYVISISSNEKFLPPKNMNLMIMSTLFMVFFYYLLNQDSMILSTKMTSKDSSSMINNDHNFNLNFMSLNKLYNAPTNLMIMMMMFYLLFTLIIIVKIIKFNKSSLRKNF
uniref:NADH-ubiquinone oxidoreductase chain 6 n=1 Tax=Runaria punctata TaxID=2950364 RepID=A0A977TL22_9HYME|nr:NADH dehydrogenase subunit 6 [Runaria punctata]UXW93357.1 NADH dehydrogenase subunit 6 [Runaria punctata]